MNAHTRDNMKQKILNVASKHHNKLNSRDLQINLQIDNSKKWAHWVLQ